MNDVEDFETFLVISHKKFEIHLLDIKNFKNLYKKEFKYETDLKKIDLNLLSEFLEMNILRIEKVARNFVNNINVIIENNSILNFDLSLKKKKLFWKYYKFIFRKHTVRCKGFISRKL